MVVSQFYVNGNASQAELCRAFGVTKISLLRAVKLYRERGPAGFYEESGRRGAAVLTKDVLVEAQRLLDEGIAVAEAAVELGVKPDTLRKAVYAGKIHRPQKKTLPSRKTS